MSVYYLCVYTTYPGHGLEEIGDISHCGLLVLDGKHVLETLRVHPAKVRRVGRHVVLRAGTLEESRHK